MFKIVTHFTFFAFFQSLENAADQTVPQSPGHANYSHDDVRIFIF